MQEIFKPIQELNGKYECSNFGRIRRVNKDIRCSKYKYLKLQVNKYGYTYVHATRNYRKLVHRIVAQLFIENKNNYPYINHKDLDKKNNHVLNLEWVTPAMNSKHASLNGKLGSMRYLILDLYTGIYYESAKDLAFVVNKSKQVLSEEILKNNIDKRFEILQKKHIMHNEETCKIIP
jgi:hypothetical protein